MKRDVSFLLLLLAAFVLSISSPAFSQEKTPVKVKSSEVVTGVVLVHLQKDAKSIELQCNEGASGCKALPAGNYQMVELPPHFGLYECKDVEVYRSDPDKPQSNEKVGEYCLTQ